jgi:hypothetical protein
MKVLAEAAIKLVNLNDTLLGSLEGMENLTFKMFYLVDCGKIRHAWYTTRRAVAVAVAQMMGLDRAEVQRFLLIDTDSDLEREVMCSTITLVPISACCRMSDFMALNAGGGTNARTREKLQRQRERSLACASALGEMSDRQQSIGLHGSHI